MRRIHGTKIKVLLSLALALVILAGTIPVALFANEDGQSAEMEEMAEVTAAEEADPEPEAAAEAEAEASAEPETSAQPGEEPTMSVAEEPETETTYTNSISGMLWYDTNDDGVRDSGEEPIANYPVYLYTEGDTDTAVQTATTDASGEYIFENIELDSYVVGVKSNELGADYYLLPMVGVTGDNKLGTWSDEWDEKYSDVFIIGTDSAVTDIDAGMRTPPGVQPMAYATYMIDMTSAATIASSISGQSIPGVTYASSLLTFTSSVDPTDTYVLYGTAAARVAVSTGAIVNITLGNTGTGVGLSIMNGTQSPFQLEGTANVNLTLGAGTINVLRCTATTTTVGVIRSGLYVPPAAKLTIDGTGELQATGGYYAAGIGGSYMNATVGDSTNAGGNITISDGTVTATGGSYGTGIGGGRGGAGGTITIGGGTVTATSGGSGVTGGGAGIGGGYGADGGTINISGGTVNATSNSSNNTCGAGIGGGHGGNGGNITISGTADVTATGGKAGAGIGGGNGGTGGGSGGNITITGGTVTATNDNGASIGGAGIGGGSGAGGGGTITISGGTVTATGGGTTWGSAGIGGGSLSGSSGAGGNITISGGAVTATGGLGNGLSGGAGIGGASDAAGGNISISGGTVTATGSGAGAGIGGGRAAAGGTISITGGLVTAGGGYYLHPSLTYFGGAGIGGGYTGAAAASLEIGAGAEVYAYSCNSANPAIWATTITGTGYYVNAYFGDGALSAVDDFDLRVHSGNYVGSYVGSVPLPAVYYCFAYTTGGTSQVYNTRAINTASGIDEGHVVEYTTYDPDILLSVNGGSAASVANLYKVRLWPLPFLGNLSHNNVTQTTADVTSTDHSFSTATNNEGYFDYDLDGTFTSGNYTRVPWTSTTTNPYTANLTGLTPNTLYSYRVYLKNEYGDTTSAAKQFLTLPQITSWTPTPTSLTTATVTGNIAASLNSQSITDVKVYLNTTNNFSTATAYPLSSSDYSDITFSYTFPASAGVIAGQTYYVWVEVSNATGTGLGGNTISTVKSFQTGGIITEKYVNNSGTALQSDTTDTVLFGSTYTYSGSLADIAVGVDTYAYIGYKVGSYTAGDTLDGTGTPTISNVSIDEDVYLVYAKLEGRITVEKYDNTGLTLLPGAEFKLEKLTGPGGSVDPGFTAQTLTATGGTCTFTNLKEGTYQITETKAPSGYSLLKEPFEVELPKEMTYALGFTPPDTSYLYSTTSGLNTTYYYYDLTYQVSDQAELKMPEAGTGDFLSQYYLLIGLAVLVVAGGAGALWIRHRRRLKGVQE